MRIILHQPLARLLQTCHKYAFAKCNEKVTLIKSDFEETIGAILDSIRPR